MEIFLILLFVLAVFGFLYALEEIPYQEQQKKEEKEYEEAIIAAENVLKGHTFEQIITQLIQEKFPDAYILNNCILMKLGKNGKPYFTKGGNLASKELDVVALTKKGLIIIEAKNWAQAFIGGSVEGEGSDVWRAVYGKKIYSKYSPFKQVTEGMLTIKKYLRDYDFTRYVVFPNSTKFCEELNNSNQVLHLQEFGWTLDELKKRPDKFNKKELEFVMEVLKNANAEARSMHANPEAAHIKYVKECEESAS